MRLERSEFIMFILKNLANCPHLYALIYFNALHLLLIKQHDIKLGEDGVFHLFILKLIYLIVKLKKYSVLFLPD